MSMKHLIAFLCIIYINADSKQGAYEILVNKTFNFTMEKPDSFKWTDFKIASDEEQILKVIVFISTNYYYIGKWTGIFRSDTINYPNSIETDQIRKSFTNNTGKVIWELDNTTSKIINKNGNLKWEVYYIDCKVYTIEKIVVITDKYNGSSTEYLDDIEPKAEKISTGVYKAIVGYNITKIGDQKSYPINLNRFNIPKNEIIKSIEITLRANSGNVGKWEGFFGITTVFIPFGSRLKKG